MTFILAITALLMTADQQAAPPPAPPPGSPAIYRAGDQLLAALRQAADRGGMTTGAIANTDQYRINLVRRVNLAVFAAVVRYRRCCPPGPAGAGTREWPARFSESGSAT